MNSRSVAPPLEFGVPPPGLGIFDAMMPAKVQLPSSSDPRYVGQSAGLEALTNPFTKDRMESGYTDQCPAYEWALKMSSLTPYLSAQAGQGHLPNFHNPYAALQVQLQAHQQRQSLLADMLQLPLDSTFADPAAVAAAACLLPPAAEPSQDLPRLPHKAMRGPSLSGEPADHPRTPQSASRKVQTLSTSLQLLSGEDPDCLFIVRRINKLGFKAVRTLKRHFSACGPVLKVLLAHSTVRQHGDPASHARRRPSSLGFIQMSNADSTNKVLALGDEQEVDGVLIRVQRFERQRMAEMEKEADSENEDLTVPRTCKIKRGFSEDSMSTSASPIHGFSTPTPSDRAASTPSEATKSPSLSSQVGNVKDIDSDRDFMA